VAENGVKWLETNWSCKFDFLRSEVDEFETLLPRILSLAGNFLMWYAARLDSTRSPVEESVNETREDVENKCGDAVASDSDGKEKETSAVCAFSRSFPIIWDEFVAEGHDESFLILDSACG
jgi:hypothetical protein